MDTKNTESAMRSFWKIMGITLFVSILVACLMIYAKPQLLLVIENEEAVVGLISFVFTLPITFAASIAVIKLGDRMDKLTEEAAQREKRFGEETLKLTRQAEVREGFTLAKEMYDDLFNKFKGVAIALNQSWEDIYWQLHTEKANKFIYFRSDEIAQAEMEDDRIRIINEADPLDWVYEPEGMAFARNFCSNVQKNRKKIIEALDGFIQLTWSVKQEVNNSRVLRAISNFRTENAIPSLEAFYAGNPSMEKETVKRFYEKLKSNEEMLMAICDSLEARLKGSVNDSSATSLSQALSAVNQVRNLIYFFKHERPREEPVRQIFEDAVNNTISVEKATDLLLGLTIFPLPLVMWQTIEVEEKDGNFYESIDSSEMREHIAKEINQIGLLSLKDLRDAWPTQEELIKHVLEMVIPESPLTEEVRGEINKRMKALPDPKNLLGNFVFEI